MVLPSFLLNKHVSTRMKWNQCPCASQREHLPVASVIWKFLAQCNPATQGTHKASMPHT